MGRSWRSADPGILAISGGRWISSALGRCRRKTTWPDRLAQAGRRWLPALASAAVLGGSFILATGPQGISASAQSAAPQSAPANDAKAKVAFIGDSTADGLWGGFSALVPRNSCLKGSIDLGRFAKNSTGLTRPDKFNWPEEAKRIGERYKPALFVISLGLNDRQSVVVGGRVTLDNAPDYPAAYKERVTALLKNAAASGAGLLWIGLPAMRDAAPDRDARDKNKMFAEAIAELGDRAQQYVPPWRLSPAGEDKFASYGPDQSGKIIQIRASDGEHFTPAGEMLVAAYLLPKMMTILQARGAKLGDDCAS